MAERVWTYRDDVRILEEDIVGYDVEATDGSLGSIDESSFEAGSGYIVVDTSSWKNLGLGQLSVLPAGVIDRIDHEDDKVYLSITKDDIKDAPPFEPRYRTEGRLEPGYRDDLAAYYDPYAAPVGERRL